MRNALLLLTLTFMLACDKEAYYGYIYDFERGQPIDGVIVNDYLNHKSTVTDSNGYFYLEHDDRISGKLKLSRSGYITDTLETLAIHSGEKQRERFKGDTVYLFGIDSRFRDSINQINRSGQPWNDND